MVDRQRKTGIVVLCGLPGAGKSFFVHALQQNIVTGASLPVNTCKQTAVKSDRSTWKVDTSIQGSHCIDEVLCVHVCYDNIITTNLQHDHKNSASGKDGVWKTYRRQIRACVEQDISGNNDVTDIPADVIAKYSTLPQVHRCFSDVEDGERNSLKLYIIDDNMFFSSMRYEYVQLARKYGTGFAQIYLESSVDDALLRNQSRPSSVPPETIITMATKLEVPDPSNHWETMTLTLSAGECCTPDKMEQVWRLILESVDNPVQPCETIDEDVRSCDRVVCSQNVIHQADQILRQLIGADMRKIKESTESSKASMKQHPEALNQRRQTILNDMRHGCIMIPSDLEHCVKDSARDQDNPLYLYITNLFHYDS